MTREPTSQLIDILTAKVEQAKAGDYVALLDLTENATEDDVKKAYFRLARMVHPDTIRKQSLMDRKKTCLCQEQHDTLRDSQQEDMYYCAA